MARARARPTGWALVLFLVLGLVGAIAQVASGLYVLLVVGLTLVMGAEAIAVIAIIALGLGWIGIGSWTLLRFVQGRWSFLIGPPAAWLWLLLGANVILRIAPVNFGY